LGSGTNFLSFFQRFTNIAEPLIQQAMVDCWQGCQGCDALVYSPLAVCTAPSIAEKLAIPSWIGAGQPLTPTASFAIPFFPGFPLPFHWLSNRYNRLTYGLSARIFWQLLRPMINKARQETLHLPPLHNSWLYENLSRQQFRILYYYSPKVLPQPPDWSSNNAVTGYWYLDDPLDWQPPHDLVDFLAAGPPPVYVGFGSMQTRNPALLMETVLKALELAKQRGILLTGGGGLNSLNQEALPDSVYKIDFVPHDWLFPQVAAVVHHGGAGTMAASLRAGVPSVMIPFFGDQPFWGRRFFAMGVIPQPILRKHLTADRLAKNIRLAVYDADLRARVHALSKHIRDEDGLEVAVKIVQHT
jgi:UDP:flavonoid glycosyltransferase YjiC (YdhE family)